MKPLLPKSNKVFGSALAEDIIGIRPNETWTEAIKRHIIEQRIKKINKIKKRKGSD